MAWIFQGSPKRFRIDEYLARYPELIYWRTPRYVDRIAVWDRAYIWRSGKSAGAIAIGKVVELPTQISKVEHPEALGDDLWWSESPDPSELRTGIHLEEVRLSDTEQMVPRTAVMSNAVLSTATIIRMPTGTVFHLPDDENRELERLWGMTAAPGAAAAEASEGERRLVAHFRRERSRWLKRKKLATALATSGELVCEICSARASDCYPAGLGTRIFEVHHRKPLATADSPVRTSLEDLAILCANCHRSVHATDDIDKNFETLVTHFRRLNLTTGEQP